MKLIILPAASVDISINVMEDPLSISSWLIAASSSVALEFRSIGERLRGYTHKVQVIVILRILINQVSSSEIIYYVLPFSM